MYKSQAKRPKNFDFDLICIGSGSGSNVAATQSAALGKRVGVVEMSAVGGECPNFGCVPTKALLTAAEYYRMAQAAGNFGINIRGVSLDYPAIKAWKDRTVRNTGTYEGAAAFKRLGIQLITGHAHFISPWTISVGGKRFSGKKFLIASGTYSLIPAIDGLKQAGYITYKDAIDLTKLPSSVFIIGGGATGCEFAEIFHTFGSKVHLAEFAPRLLAREDQEVGDLVRLMFQKRGMEVHVNSRVVKVDVAQSGQKIVHYITGDKTHQATVDVILVTTGKAPMTDMGLENAKVAYGGQGITVNQYMQTSNKHIYAAGDIVGPYMFTHTAAYQSRLVANNLWHRKKVEADYRAVPRCIFVSPEVASAGLGEHELTEAKIAYHKATVPTRLIGRSNTSKQVVGFVKVITDANGVILGGSIVAPRAGEMIHELTLAIQMRLNARDIETTIHAFPTWSEAVRLACSKLL